MLMAVIEVLTMVLVVMLALMLVMIGEVNVVLVIKPVEVRILMVFFAIPRGLFFII